MTGVTNIEGSADPMLEAVPHERVQVLKMAIPPGERRSNVVVAHVLVSRVIIAFRCMAGRKAPFRSARRAARMASMVGSCSRKWGRWSRGCCSKPPSRSWAV